eukprot:m.35737 g.35737  ORF g.35737 m.35737 type:complete len:287 (+) comp7471_c0_seq1:56-916(+)
MDGLRVTINDLGDKFLLLLNPDFYPERPTKDWPLASFDQALFVALAYVVFVAVGPTIVKATIGPDAYVPPKDKNGQPKKLSVAEKFSNEPLLYGMAVYNIAQVGLCGYMMYGAILAYTTRGYSPICNVYDKENPAVASILWVFYMSKILDFFDTLFIVLRRKWVQLSTLHVYHHFSIFLMYWVNLNAGYDGDIYYTIVANSFVHFVMYFYYFLTSLNVPVPIRVKKAITQLQMGQFLTMNAQALYIRYNNCPYPAPLTWFYLFYIISLFILFNQFSQRTYKAKKEN